MTRLVSSLPPLPTTATYVRALRTLAEKVNGFVYLGARLDAVLDTVTVLRADPELTHTLLGDGDPTPTTAPDQEGPMTEQTRPTLTVNQARTRLLNAALHTLSVREHPGLTLEHAYGLLAFAARGLADATDAADRKPVGWDTPTKPVALPDARTQTLRAVLHVLSAEFADEHAYADADAELADEELALAARDLTRAVDAAPTDRQPSGWTR